MREDSGAAPGLTSVPEGGGGVASLGDRFEPDLLRGSGSYAVPLHLPRGPNDLQPSLGLTYSSGSGNGPFGQGWRLGLPRIERRTDRGVPVYDDDLDTFVLGDAEELVPVGGGRYRPRTDTKFWSIIRAGDAWVVRTGDGTTLRFGQTPASRETNGAAIFSWHLDEQRDAAGNAITFTYRRDGGRLYPDKVRWSIFDARFVYETRADVLRNGRAGFLRTTALRAHALEISSERAAPALLRSYVFEYQPARNGPSRLTRLSLSASVGTETARFPDLTFAYADFDPSGWRVETLRSEIPPPRAEDPAGQWVDLTGDGLPDVLLTSGRMLLWRNRGDGWLDGPAAIGEVPATVTLARPNVAFADLNGNGRVDLFAVDQPLQLAYTADGRGGFLPEPVVFRDRPTLRLSAPDTRLTDLDGDGVTDFLQTGRSAFLMFRHAPDRGWQEPDAVARVADLAVFPDITLGDHGVSLTDMTGDGLDDLLFLRSGQAWYWPNLGHGRWDGCVEMDGPPQFPTGYREDRIVIADIDGDGCADVLYLDADRTLIWLNRAGAGFAPPIEIPVVPPPQSRVLALDLFGDGRPGLAWSAPAVVADDAGYRVLRLAPGTAPYVLTSVRNGMGRHTTIEYSTSAAMLRADREAGAEWPGVLPLVVTVARTIRDDDEVTGASVEMTIAYHDGVYDGPRREFRGFGRVTVDLAGDDSIPASRQEYTFFLGDPEHADLMERDRQRALAGSQQVVRSFSLGEGAPVPTFETKQTWQVAIDATAGGANIFMPRLVGVENREFGVGEPDRLDRALYSEFDAHGNPRRVEREWSVAGGPTGATIREEERFTFVENETAWLVKLPARRERRDGEGTPLDVEIHSYDGPPFEGLAEGSATHGLPTRSRALALREAALPADYAADFAALGYTLQGDGDLRGHYATSFCVERDARGNIVGRKDPMGRLSTIAFDADGVYPVASVNARGRTTTVTFDPRAGAPIRLASPDGPRFRWTFDPLGRQTARFETDDGGTEQMMSAWSVDVAQPPTSVTTFKPRTPGRQPAEFQQGVDLTLLADVAIMRTFFDGAGNSALTVGTAPDGPNGARRFVATGRARRNPRGLVSLEYAPEPVADLAFSPAPMDPGSSATLHRYDARGNSIETVGPGPVHFRVARDTFSLRHFEGDAAGPWGAARPPATPTRIERFDARSRVVRIEEFVGDGTFIATAYDLTPDARIEVLRDDTESVVARYTFVGPSEPIRIAHRDAGTRSYYRDAGGLIARMDAADGAQLHYGYDLAGRLVRIESQNAGEAARTLVREYVYDGDPRAAPTAFLDGRLAMMREPGLTVRFAYDRAGRETAETFETLGVSLGIRKEYDLRGDVSAVVYPDGRRVEFARDGGGAVTAIAGIVTTVSYDIEGHTIGYTCANGLTVTLPRDPVSGRLLETSARMGAGPIRSLVYAYDAIGSITGIDDSVQGSAPRSTSYAYDGLHRLAGFAIRDGGPAGAVVRAGAYEIDATGNLRGLREQDDLTLTYADAARPGRLTEVTEGGITRALGYDARGRLVSFGDLTQIGYDALDRTVKVGTVDGTEIQLVDDHLGRPCVREVSRSGASARVVFAAGLYERHDDRVVRNIHLGRFRVARETVSAAGVVTSFFLTDHHGTALLETDAAGATVGHQRYSAFGQPLDPATSLSRYVDHDLDAGTGLVHFGARMYMPRIGRFLIPDWYVLENPDKPIRMPQGYNLYSYALNNPLVFDDPGGRWFFLPAIVGFAVGLIYGYADGRSADGSWSLAKETALTTWVGFNLGWMAGMMAPIVGGTALAGFTGAMGGLNGLFTGTRQIYDDIQFFGSAEGIASLVADSSWGILGTTLGNAVNVYNLIAAPSSYRSDLSKGQNRQVYDRGLAYTSSKVFAQGNVISNMSKGKPQGGDPGRKLHHESLHVFQSRVFGPFFQITYVGWLAAGALIGTVVAGSHGDDAGEAIKDFSYYNNPWELWAYEHGGDPKKGKYAW